MQILIGFLAVFLSTAGIGFYKGYKSGRALNKKRWEDEIRYVTTKELENIISEMRENGADDNSIAVLLKVDWWEGLI